MARPDGAFRPLPQIGPEGIGHEFSRTEMARREQINGVLRRYDIARPFSYVGDVRRGEIELLGAQEVISLARSGLYLVHLPAQSTPDTFDTDGRMVPGKRNDFWPVFQDENLAARSQIVVPFVRDAPGNYSEPVDIPREDSKIERINHVLREHHLRDLPPPVGLPQEQILDIADIIQANEKFFSVVVFRTKDHRGVISEKPLLINARSDEGVAGAVFAPTVHLPMYGMLPRYLMGDNYRPTLGDWSLEYSRGFYSPALGGKNLRIKGFTDLPVFKRIVEELGSETGLTDADLLRYRGVIRQDPSFEFNEPFLYSLVAEAAKFGPRDLEASEKIRQRYIDPGEFFALIPQITDAFTLTAWARDTLNNGRLILTKDGENAAANHERMVFMQPYRLQYGEHTTEAIRTSLDNGFPIDDPAGEIAVNSGIARITPDVYVGRSSWNDIKVAAQRAEISSLQLLYPYEVLNAIKNEEFDNVTTAAAVRALIQQGYLQYNYLGRP